MSKFKKGGSKDLPAISTASLPDIVFMLLFFFMVATVMRDSTLMVDNVLPSADQVEKLENRSLTMYVYAGKPGQGYKKYGSEARVQLNDKFVTNLTEVQNFVQQVRAETPEDQIGKLMTALKVDKKTNMGLVGDIKEQLREVNQLKINYSTKGSDISRN